MVEVAETVSISERTIEAPTRVNADLVNADVVNADVEKQISLLKSQLEASEHRVTEMHGLYGVARRELTLRHSKRETRPRTVPTWLHLKYA